MPSLLGRAIVSAESKHMLNFISWPPSLLSQTLPPSLSFQVYTRGVSLLTAATLLLHSLAYSEMRLIMARMVWNFDMRLAKDSHDWVDKTELYLLWDKGPLNVYLTPRLNI
jgi:hypothetical protein